METNHPRELELDPTDATDDAASGAPPPAVIDVTAANFEREVLQRSREVPVLLDFWAAWCAPCRTLGPVLERLAEAERGRLVLGKIDTEAEQELAAAFQIQSIPTVLLFVDGRPVDGFMGALSEAQVRAFLGPHLPAAGGSGAGASSSAGQVAKVLEAARALEADEGRAAAIAHLAEAFDGPGAHPELRLELARLLVEEGRAREAEEVASELGPDDWDSEAGRALRARLDFVAERGAADLESLRAAQEASPDDLDTRLAYGRALVAANRPEAGLEQLFAAAQRDLRHAGGAPRKALLEVFELLGPEHPLTLEYQRRLSHLLCL